MKPILVNLTVAVVAIGVGFWTGTAYQKKQIPQFTPSGRGAIVGGTRSGSGRRAGGGLGGFINGQITAVDATSITVKESNGSSQVVYFSGTSKITQDAPATKDNLKVGTTVMASGTPNSDNSVTATTIRIATP